MATGGSNNVAYKTLLIAAQTSPDNASLYKTTCNKIQGNSNADTALFSRFCIINFRVKGHRIKGNSSIILQFQHSSRLITYYSKTIVNCCVYPANIATCMCSAWMCYQGMLLLSVTIYVIKYYQDGPKKNLYRH